tara:strand:+ start:373 stop:546 length:174 start_codon:yes stop_codon:yes gene_type:complete
MINLFKDATLITTSPMINRINTIDKGLYLIAEVISKDAREWNDLSIPQPGQLIENNC